MTLILYFCFAVSRSVSRGRVFSLILLSLTLVSVSHHRQNNTMSGFDQVRKYFFHLVSRVTLQSGFTLVSSVASVQHLKLASVHHHLYVLCVSVLVAIGNT